MPCCYVETHVRHAFPNGIKRKNQRLSKLKGRVLRSPVVRSPHFICKRLTLREGPGVKQVVSENLPASDFQAKKDITDLLDRMWACFEGHRDSHSACSLLTFYSFFFFPDLLVNMIFSLVSISALVLNHEEKTREISSPQ